MWDNTEHPADRDAAQDRPITLNRIDWVVIILVTALGLAAFGYSGWLLLFGERS